VEIDSPLLRRVVVARNPFLRLQEMISGLKILSWLQKDRTTLKIYQYAGIKIYREYATPQQLLEELEKEHASVLSITVEQKEKTLSCIVDKYVLGHITIGAVELLLKSGQIPVSSLIKSFRCNYKEQKTSEVDQRIQIEVGHVLLQAIGVKQFGKDAYEIGQALANAARYGDMVRVNLLLQANPSCWSIKIAVERAEEYGQQEVLARLSTEIKEEV
jgi:hypothetical protein